MKKRLLMILALVLALSGGVVNALDEVPEVNLYINDEKYMTEAPVLNEMESGVLVPLREVGEKLGYEVVWNDADWTIDVQKGDTVSKLKIDSSKVESGVNIELKFKPVLKDKTTYVPVEFFGNVLDKVVTWDSVRGILSISDTKEATEGFFKKSTNAKLTGKLAEIAKAFEAKQNFQGTVLVAKDGEVLHEGGYGLSDTNLNLKSNVQTKYGIGSMTKQFSATSIMQLVEEGKVKVTDSVSKYIDGLAHGDAINIDQLLTHESGLVNVTDLPEFYALVDPTPAEVIALVKDSDLIFEPGTQYVYNNTNYILLGMIVEKVSGVTLEEYLHENIFEPLAMEDTGTAYGERPGFHIATPYQGYIETFEVDDKPLLANVYGAGNMYSTVEDMYRWSVGIDGDKILKQASKDEMFKKHIETSPTNGYGYGWQTGETEDGKFIEHGGTTLGFMSDIYKNLTEDITIVVLSNRRLADVNSLVYTLEEEVLGQEVNIEEDIEAYPTEVELTEAELDAYVGTYVGLDPTTGEDGEFIVSREGKALMIKFAGQDAFQVFAKGDHSFFYKLLELDLKFTVDENGKATTMDYNQIGYNVRAVNKDNPPEIVEVDAKTLESYAGTYAISEGFKLEITVVDGVLYAQATGQEKFALAAVSNTEFEYTNIPATIEFVAGEDGTIEELVLHQNGQDIPAKRV